MAMVVRDVDAFVFINKPFLIMDVLHIEYGGLAIYPIKLSEGQFSLLEIGFQLRNIV